MGESPEDDQCTCMQCRLDLGTQHLAWRAQTVQVSSYQMKRNLQVETAHISHCNAVVGRRGSNPPLNKEIVFLYFTALDCASCKIQPPRIQAGKTKRSLPSFPGLLLAYSLLPARSLTASGGGVRRSRGCRLPATSTVPSRGERRAGRRRGAAGKLPGNRDI